uniref:Uncharacterized protein n=1 Tax=Terrapene triunguis TaxID=2587831 RepID=A0A674J6J7_9SAUR
MQPRPPPLQLETIAPSCLLCADPNLPRPSISLSPTWVTPLGADVTIRCQGQRRDVRFFLHKAGDLNLQRHPGSALSPDPTEGTPGRGAGTESLGGSPARGEQQPLENRGREATLMLPLVRRNRESLFNPMIPSPVCSWPCPRQCPGWG